VRRRLRRPAVVIPAAALVLLAAGIGYSAYERVDTSAIEANADLLASVPTYPGARERDRRSDTASTGGLPLPEGVVTTVLYLPPEGATQEGLVDFYVRRLRGWTPRTTTIPASGTEQDAYRVEFVRADDCLTLMTFGMAAGRPGPRTFALAALANEGGCD
jgi:hypothetical protein